MQGKQLTPFELKVPATHLTPVGVGVAVGVGVGVGVSAARFAGWVAVSAPQRETLSETATPNKAITIVRCKGAGRIFPCIGALLIGD